MNYAYTMADIFTLDKGEHIVDLSVLLDEKLLYNIHFKELL